MSVPLGARPVAAAGGPRPTEHQLRLAHERARMTGESVARVLSVFLGGGRYGEAAVDAAGAADAAAGAGGGAGAPSVAGPLVTSGPPGPAAPAGRDGREGSDGQDTGGAGEFADVIPLSRARGRRSGGSGGGDADGH
ncbi:hypothetical protein HCC61_24500 [Streptomyces sp. HNM0575]|uniref:hypothetical protein n=1 Tax=Streptomyces sp. HNM0575 TaxID=2716338 RepID=UPI00145F117B|nr:hypothetical protein [Streptomyces sp. HNM0575]NLU75773.1 hypothetical protein [Streptomyces sp. HNM0575]